MSIWSDTANLFDKDRYDPLGWAARRLAPREPARLAGVPNPQRDDPLPRFDPDAAEKRAIGATAWGSVYGAEPRTPEELEVASGVDRRIPDAPREWSEPTRIPGLGSYATAPGGIAIAHGTPPPVRDIAPRVPFADAPGESFADTVRRGAQARALAEREGLTTADMDYIRSYGRRAFDERNARFSAPATRADYLARQAGNLAVSVAERRAAQDELARLDRLAADERRREMWAAEQAGLTERARIAASVPVVGPGGVVAYQNPGGGYTVDRPPAGASGPNGPTLISRDTAGWLGENNEFVPNPAYERDSEVEEARGKWKTDVQALANEGKINAEQVRAAARIEAAGIRADAQKYASDNLYRTGLEAGAARVEAAKAAGLSAEQVARIRAEVQERVARIASDGALARAGIQADAQKYISDNAYAARADAAAAAVEAAMATADARVSAERVRAEGARLLAAENPWVALGGGVMGNRQTGDQAGRPNATAAAAKPQIFKMKGADGTERLVRPREDGAGVEVLFEDPDAALVIAEQEVRNLESDKLRYGRTTAQREGYDERIAEAKARLAALREARRSAPDYEGPTGRAPTNDAADGWAAFGGIVR